MPKGELKLGVNEEHRDALLLAQKRTGIDAAAIASVINAEAARDKSGKWIANSQASTSKAQGLTQFIPDTWEGHAKTGGTLLNEVAVQMGYIREAGGKILVTNRAALLALRNDPTLSIVSGAEFGKDNLAKLQRNGFLPANISDDEKAKYMYYAHHEGFAGATRFLTDSRTTDEATAKRVLSFNLRPSTVESTKQKYGSYAEAYKHFAESEGRRIFPIQVGRNGTAIMNSYVQKYGSYEQGYHVWLKDYTDKNSA